MSASDVKTSDFSAIKSRKWQTHVFLVALVVMLACLVGRIALPAAQDVLMSVFLWSIYFALCLLVGLAADRMLHRSFIGWTVLAILFTPIVAAIFLSAAGLPLAAYESVRRDQYAEKEAVAAEEEHLAEHRCPSCGNPLNLLTRKGFRSPEDEPWRMICDQCNGDIDVDAMEDLEAMHSGEV